MFQSAHGRIHREEDPISRDRDPLPSPYSSEVLALLKRYPLPKLRTIDIEGRLTLQVFQLLVGAADVLTELHVTNTPMSSSSPPGLGLDQQHQQSPGPRSNGALGDEWLDALARCNELRCLNRLTLRLDCEQPVEAGWFSEAGLSDFLGRCLAAGSRLSEVVGEFTRIPDKQLKAKTEWFAAKGLRELKVRCAVQYRR